MWNQAWPELLTLTSLSFDTTPFLCWIKCMGDCFSFCYKAARAEKSKDFFSIMYYKIGREWYCMLSQNVFRSFNISLKRENPYQISFWNEISFQIFQIKLPRTAEVTTALKCYSTGLSKAENPLAPLISRATRRIGTSRGANPLNLRSQS